MIQMRQTEAIERRDHHLEMMAKESTETEADPAFAPLHLKRAAMHATIAMAFDMAIGRINWDGP